MAVDPRIALAEKVASRILETGGVPARILATALGTAVGQASRHVAAASVAAA